MEGNNYYQVICNILGELAVIDSQIAALMSAEFDRQTLSNVENKTNEMRSSMLNEAKRYGQTAQVIEEPVEEYSESLNQIRSEFENEKNLWLLLSQKYQNNEIKHILEIAQLKKELAEAQKQAEQARQPKSTKPKVINEEGLEVAEGDHPLLNHQTIMDNLSNASLEDVSAQLDYYNGKPVLLNGAYYHPFNEPVSAARLNERYRQLTGENHPNFMEQAPQVIDGLLRDEEMLLKAGAYPRDYFDTISKIKDNIKNEKEKPKDNEKPKNNDYKAQIEAKKQDLKVDRECSEEAKNNINDCQDRCNETLDGISDNKDLAKSDGKQSIFSKLLAKVRDRIGGKEKFNRDVIEPLKNKVAFIKQEVLPEVIDKIEQDVMPKLGALIERGKEKVNEMDLKGKFNQLMAVAKEGSRNIIDRSKAVKDKAVSAFAKGITFAKEGMAQLIDKASDLTL